MPNVSNETRRVRSSLGSAFLTMLWKMPSAPTFKTEWSSSSWIQRTAPVPHTFHVLTECCRSYSGRRWRETHKATGGCDDYKVGFLHCPAQANAPATKPTMMWRVMPCHWSRTTSLGTLKSHGGSCHPLFTGAGGASGARQRAEPTPVSGHAAPGALGGLKPQSSHANV